MTGVNYYRKYQVSKHKQKKWGIVAHAHLDSTEKIFKIGSTDPPAMLYDALDHYEVRCT